jgi:transglutaminase-like putative cysteine protease
VFLKAVLLVLFFVICFLFSASSSFAQNFSTDYNVTYQVFQNARTNVSFDVTLTNETEQYYASSYSIQVSFSEIQNLKASDSQGSITPEVTKTPKGNIIKLNFNDKITGLGNKLNFKLSFETTEIAQNQGTVWEVNVPGLSNQSDYSSFNVSVLYPPNIGRPTFIKPSVNYESSQGRLSFTKNSLGTSGISIAFGEFQVYDFDLTYHLSNKNLFPVKTEIALPPSTNYQDVLITSLNPKPENVRKDKDGNWLAEYNLSPSQTIEVKAIGKARINFTPKQETVEPAELKEYLKEKPYWQTQNPEIKKLAQQLKTPRAIYQYVVDSLNYDFSRVTDNLSRAGAVGVLENPESAVCLEFTDLFVAIARSAGIPAREIDGFANTRNSLERPLSLRKDVLHAWPEYYDSEKKTWIMIDPTWGNTTGGVDYFDVLDFDHFAFVKKGLDSDYPVPAGGYKLSRDGGKDVNVSFGQTFETVEKKEIGIVMSDQFFPGAKVKGIARVKNSGNTISNEEEILISSTSLAPGTRNIVVGEIPPFGYVDIPFEFDSKFLTNAKDTIKITTGKNEYVKTILISPFFVNEITKGGLILVAIIILSIIAYRSGRLHLRR